ncbi:MAG: NUDIX hydrolase [Brachymonas sp.]|uniref:NUDIX hydrolase n=1 Tax=Brachymonas sp. TaxID=1936292 RepID=UPI0035AEB401
MFTPIHQPPRTAVHFCRYCGHATELREPEGDNRKRAVCPSCGTIHYINPLVVVGTLPVWQDRILLCKRNIEPRRGKWTLPAGFMELHETTSQGAARETMEESGAEFDMGPLFGVMNVPEVGQVHMFYLCTLRHDRFDPGHETMEARLFSEEEIPWEELSFRTVEHMLRTFLADRAKGHFGVHVHDFMTEDTPT